MHVLPKPPPEDDSLPNPGGPMKYRSPQEAARIYFLPNLFTAGNLFFGFVSIIRCIQARYVAQNDQINSFYTEGVWCILLAAFCDALDGRLARLGGRESLFGKEFDSIADTVSFGVAPALMVFFLILAPTGYGDYTEIFRQTGWLIGFIYLLCVAVRLARFNVLTNPLVPGVKESASTKDFMGLPSPAAAGFVASLVLVMLNLEFKNAAIQQWVVLWLPLMLLPLLLLVALLMVSNIPYPSFKYIDWQMQAKARPFILVIIALVVAYRLRVFSFAIFFLCYIFYGLGRYVRKAWKKKYPSGTEEPASEPEDEDAF